MPKHRTPTVKIDLKPLIKFQRQINDDLRAGGQVAGGSPISNALKQWAVRYRSFVQQRFLLFSRGGGNWQPLKKSTINRRRGRKKNKASTVAILRDTSTLFNALSPEFLNKPGAIQQAIPFGVRVGYGGPARHPSAKQASIAEIAEFHQIGAGHLPKREIIVDPSATLIKQMAEDMSRALIKLRGE